MAAQESKGPWWLPIALAIASMVVASWVGFSHNDKAMAERVSKLEAHQEDGTLRLDRIETKIDGLTKAVMVALQPTEK